MTPHNQWKLDHDSRRRRWNAAHESTHWLKRMLVNAAWAAATNLISAGSRMRLMMMPVGGIGRPDIPLDDGQPPPKRDLGPFPGDFLWGAATAAIQAEGCIDNSDWSLFTTESEIIQRVRDLSGRIGRAYNLEAIGTAAHHGDLEVLKKDLDRAVLLGLNAYRFSIEWARVMPDGSGIADQEALQYYSDAVDAMRERGLEPIVTLNHVSLPLWVCRPPVESGPLFLPREVSGVTSFVNYPNVAVEDEGYRDARGWENPDTTEYYRNFVEAVLDKLASKVTRWITLNEPTSTATLGYVGGIWPPGFTFEGNRARTAYFNLLKAHSSAFRAIKAHYANNELNPPEVGISLAIVHFSISSEVAPEVQAIMEGAVRGAGIGSLVGGIIGGIVGLVGGTAGSILGMVIGGGIGALVGAAIGSIVGAIWGVYNDVNELALKQVDYFYNRHALDSLTSGSVDMAINYQEVARDLQDALSFFDTSTDTKFSSQLDFIGVNYYRNASIHYNSVLNQVAPYAGGAVFNNDMRASIDLPSENYRNEEHGILSDLGWDMFPEGLRIMLMDLSLYGLPLLITENGHPESTDRNRAPHLLAHLQQMRIAMDQGAKLIGYCYWSLVDNFEWQAGYEPAGRFGLFEIVRPAQQTDVRYDCETSPPGRTFTRLITEGALALQYFIANNNNGYSSAPFPSAIARFGIMSPDGKSIEPPTKQAGALWEATFQTSAEFDPTFRLYLTSLDDDETPGAARSRRWLGMAFDLERSEWVRLVNLFVNDTLAQRVTLGFERHFLAEVLPNFPPEPRTEVYLATTRLPSTPGVFNQLEGTVTTHAFNNMLEFETPWTASRLLNVGMWTVDSGSSGLTHLAIRNWEGEPFRPFQVKYLMGTPEWQPRRASTTWTGSRLRVDDVRSYGSPSLRLRSLDVNSTGTSLSGTVKNRGGTSSSWTASRIGEDVGF